MNKKKILLGILLIGLGIGLFRLQPKIDELKIVLGRTPFELVIRDIVIATVAHIKAGDNIPFEMVYGIEEIDWNKIDYSRYQLINQLQTYDTKTNSVWLADKMRLIVPFFQYEGIREEPRYPSDIYITPYVKESDSFHLLGQAMVDQGLVLFNERFFMEPERRDLRQIYSTMVHELIHQQQGAFQWSMFFVDGEIRNTGNIEPKTQAATVEVLAGMCHYRDDVACRAFWNNISNYARGSLLMRLKMYGWEDWYDKIADLLWRDANDTIARDKSLRHWMLDDELRQYYYTIINDYQKDPWENIVIGGICGGVLDTGFQEETLLSTRDHPKYQIKYMTFDDTTSMFGEFLTSMVCKLQR